MTQATLPTRARECVAAFLILVIVIGALAGSGRTIQAELTGSGDEASYFLTSLMIHDYIRAGLPRPAMQYAKNYYEHYPKIGLGHWPPVYFVLLALWFLLFGAGKVSALLFQCVISSAFLTLIYAMLRRWFDPWLASIAVLFAVAMPQVAELSRTLSSEVLISSFVLAAVLFLERFLHQPNMSSALGLASAALLATLTKGTAIMLLPLSVILVSANCAWGLVLRSRIAWVVLGVTIALATPWYLLAPSALHERVRIFGGPGWYASRYRFDTTFGFWPEQLGLPGLLLAATGAAVFLVSRRCQLLRPFGYFALASPVVTLIFRFTILTWEPRHFVAMLPFVLIFVSLGLSELARLLGGGSTSRAAVSSLVLVLAFLQVRNLPPKREVGFTPVARHLLAMPRSTGRFLIVSGSIGEGALISEVAMLDRRPGYRIDRGSKVLVAADFMGRHVNPRYHSVEELSRLLSNSPYRAIVLDDARPPDTYIADVRNALASPSSGWLIEHEFPRQEPISGHGRILVWTRRWPVTRTP